MDECVVYDGFMAGGCTKLRQIQGICLAGSIRSISTSTAAIFGLKETEYQKLGTYEIGSSTKTLTDNLYVLNGRAVFFANASQNFICVSNGWNN